MENIEKNWGKLIKNARIEANLSRDELAKLSGIPKKSIERIENRQKTNPRPSTLKKLAKVLNLEFNNLTEYSNNITLGEVIKNARLKATLSQIKLADLCGISKNQLIRIENNKIKKPQTSTLKALADELNFDLDKLLQLAGYTDKQENEQENLGYFIKDARLKAGLSLNKAADLCQISFYCFTSIESGKIKKPHNSTLKALADGLNLDLTKLNCLAGYYAKQENAEENLDNFIKTARLESGLSKNQLSQLCGLPISVLHNIESGKSEKISLETLKALAKNLNLDLIKIKKLAKYENEEEIEERDAEINEDESLADYIKNARLSYGFSSKKLAQSCELAIATLLDIESGKTKMPYVSTLQTIAKQLNLDLEKLVKLAGYKNNLDNEQENLGSFIKNARLKAALDIEELAINCNISISNLYAIENGITKKPYLSTLKILAEKLNLDLSKLKTLAGYNNNLDNEQENLANFIKIARLESGLSINQLAKLCKISTYSLRHIESRKIKKPQISTLTALSKHLNLDLEKLIHLAGYTDKQENENENLANFIEKAQLEAGFSTPQLANLCQIPTSVLYTIKSGDVKKPQISTLKALAEKLNLDLAKLMQLAGYTNIQENLQQNLGSLIESARLKAGFSTNQLADLCEISPKNLYSIKKGIIKQPNISTLKRLSKHLNLDFDKLLKLAGYKSHQNNEQKNLANFIRNARLTAGFSINQLANLCEISPCNLRYIESGKIKKPFILTLQILSKKLNLDLNKLMKLAGYDNVNDEQKTLANIIKNARLEANFSLEKLAQLCQLPASTFYRIELGEVKKPHLKTLECLSKYLNLDLKKLKKLAGYPVK